VFSNNYFEAADVNSEDEDNFVRSKYLLYNNKPRKDKDAADAEYDA